MRLTLAYFGDTHHGFSDPALLPDSTNFGLSWPQLCQSQKAKGGSQVRVLKDSSESTPERSRRLLRECKGRVNAGACAGYTY